MQFKILLLSGKKALKVYAACDGNVSDFVALRIFLPLDMGTDR
jgi:hypothetical protein